MRLHWKLRKAIGFHHKQLTRATFDILRECVQQRLKRVQQRLKRKRRWTERDDELALVQMYRRSLNPNHRDHPILGSQLTKEGIKEARHLQQFYEDHEIFAKIYYR